jgi:hypothetical protein
MGLFQKESPAWHKKIKKKHPAGCCRKMGDDGLEPPTSCL